jgi:hypothetical protein
MNHEHHMIHPHNAFKGNSRNFAREMKKRRLANINKQPISIINIRKKHKHVRNYSISSD